MADCQNAIQLELNQIVALLDLLNIKPLRIMKMQTILFTNYVNMKTSMIVVDHPMVRIVDFDSTHLGSNPSRPANYLS